MILLYLLFLYFFVFIAYHFRLPFFVQYTPEDTFKPCRFLVQVNHMERSLLKDEFTVYRGLLYYFPFTKHR